MNGIRDLKFANGRERERERERLRPKIMDEIRGLSKPITSWRAFM